MIATRGSVMCRSVVCRVSCVQLAIASSQGKFESSFELARRLLIRLVDRAHFVHYPPHNVSIAILIFCFFEVY